MPLRSVRFSPRLPILAREKQKSAHPREFHEIQKKTAKPFLRSPLFVEVCIAASSSGLVPKISNLLTDKNSNDQRRGENR